MTSPKRSSPTVRSAALARGFRPRRAPRDPVGTVVVLAQLAIMIAMVLLAALAIWGSIANLTLFVVVFHAMFACAVVGSLTSAFARGWFDIVRPAPLANAAVLAMPAFVILSNLFAPSFTRMLPELLAGFADTFFWAVR